MDKSTVFVKAEAREPDSIDSSSSDYGDDCDSVQDSASDEDEIRPTTQTLGFSINYVEGWRRIDAFREFYQNWYLLPLYGKRPFFPAMCTNLVL